MGEWRAGLCEWGGVSGAVCPGGPLGQPIGSRAVLAGWERVGLGRAIDGDRSGAGTRLGGWVDVAGGCPLPTVGLVSVAGPVGVSILVWATVITLTSRVIVLTVVALVTLRQTRENKGLEPLDSYCPEQPTQIFLFVVEHTHTPTLHPMHV